MNRHISTSRRYIDIQLIILSMVATAIWVYFIVINESGMVMAIDSPSYLSYPFGDLEGAMTSFRTFGYPLFLEIVSAVTGGLDAVPAAQLFIFLLSVIVYFIAVRHYTHLPWMAFCAALPIMNTVFPYRFYNQILTDLLGCSMMILAMASTLYYAKGNGKLSALLLLGVAVFMSYQVRPAYLFMLAVVPVIYLVLIVLEQRFRANLKNLFAVTAICVLPFLAFCLFRLIVIGHFNLVSFGGYNMIGLTSSMLEPQVIESLHDEDRSLAQEIYEERLARGYGPIKEKFDDNFLDTAFAWGKEFNMNIWKITIPIMVKRKHPGRVLTSDEYAEEIILAPEKNEQISRISRAVILQEPLLYSKWVVFQMYAGLSSTAVDYRQSFWLILILMILIPYRFYSKGFAGYRDSFMRSLAPVVIAAGCLLAGLLLISLIETVLTRYSQAVAIFVPGALLAHIYSLCVE